MLFSGFISRQFSVSLSRLIIRSDTVVSGSALKGFLKSFSFIPILACICPYRCGCVPRKAKIIFILYSLSSIL
jgi:hypothetical protein